LELPFPAPPQSIPLQIRQMQLGEQLIDIHYHFLTPRLFRVVNSSPFTKEDQTLNYT
jgi:hypothetical protein